MNRDTIQTLIFNAIAMANHARQADQQIPLTPTTALYGNAGHLDSMALVAFLIDIEEALQDEGHTVSLSDERAMSQTRSPFRSVETLVDYIDALLTENATA